MLESLSEKEEKSSPWFIQVSFTGASAPFQAPDRFIKLYEQKQKMKGNIKEKQKSFEENVIRKGMVSAVDEAIGKIMSKLKSSEDWDNTIVIFLSDNGSSAPEGNLPFKGIRGSLQEGGVRVPAFITSPLMDETVQGCIIKNVTHITDIFPTILSLAGSFYNFI